MKKTILLTLAFLVTFGAGFAANAWLQHQQAPATPKARATGIGGIFFKSKNPAKMRTWYQQHLGLNTNPYGAVFEWRQGMDTTKKGFTQWSLFGEKTRYFEPSTKDFMINYRVTDLDALVTALRQDSVIVTDTIQTVAYGKFVHILDPEGNKLELWEPNDAAYEAMGAEMGLKTTK